MKTQRQRDPTPASSADPSHRRQDAQRTLAAVPELLATMSHEIRTPMNAIVGTLSLLLETPLDEEQHDYASTMRNASDALLTIINNFLDLSRIEAGRLTLEAIAFDIRTAVEETLLMFAAQARQKNLDLVCLVNHDVPTTLVGDPCRLRQVLNNLVGNAIKFTQEGEVVVRVRLAAGGKRSARIRVEVSDSGIGIAPDARKRLFEPFFQADGAVARQYGGSGLGLAICRRLCEQMGGRIGVRSRPGKGSTFHFTIPLGIAGDAAEPGGSDLDALRDQSLLIVESRDASRHALSSMARAWGLRVDAVTTGRQAIDLLRAHTDSGRPYQLALITQELEDAEGIALASRIASDLDILTPRMILLAGMGQRGQGDQARRAGVAGFLSKPIRHQQLRDCMLAVLDPGAGRPDKAMVTRHTLVEFQARMRPRILLAEDNPINQKVIVKVLEKLDCRVDLAVDGMDAVRAATAGAYDLIFMDCLMPRLDGINAAMRIRSHEKETGRAPTPIVALTGNVVEEEHRRGLDAGIDEFLIKPAKTEALKAAIDKWVRSSAGDSPIDRALSCLS